MNDFVIETQIDKLIDLLNKRRKIALSEAAGILNVKESQVEQWVGTLEDRGVVELKYPVLGEPEIVIKGIIPENLKIETKPEIKSEETTAPREESNEVLTKKKTKTSYTENRKILEAEERKIKNVSEKITNLEKKLSEVTAEVDISKIKEELFETLMIMSSLKDTEMILSYISYVERIALFFKTKNILSKTDKDFITSILKNISEYWKCAKREDIAKIFDETVKKIETI